MASSSHRALYPIAIVQDRYDGAYSDGRWLALAEADKEIAGMARSAWVLEFGPHGGDVEANEFWNARPSWIAAGETPDQALAALIAESF